MRVPASAVSALLRVAVRPVLGPPVPIRVQRRWQDAVSRVNGGPRGVTCTPVVLGGRPAWRLDPPGALPDCAVLWLHGGAFVSGSFATHGSFAAALARAAGVSVYVLDYRLAPEHRHPAAVQDALAALAVLPEPHVVLGGDSAGGYLALLTALALPGKLRGLALVSPVVDGTRRTAGSYTGRDVLIRQSWLDQGTRAAFGSAAPNLLEAGLAGLPPAVVHVSEHERLRAEGEALAGLLGAELLVVPGAWHDVHLQAATVREAAAAVDRLGGSLSRMW